MAVHIQQLEIKTFRSIKNLVIENLGSVNLFVGDNNTGKTSVLEAVQLFCNPTEYNMMQIARQREKYRTSNGATLNMFKSVLYLFDVNESGKLNKNYSVLINGVVRDELFEVSITGGVFEQLVDLKEEAKRNPILSEKNANQDVVGLTEIPTFVGNIKNDFQTNRQMGLWDEVSHFEINPYSRIFKNKRNEKAPILNVNMIQTIDHIVADSFENLIKNSGVKEKAIELLHEFDDEIVDIRYIKDDNDFVPVIENKSGDFIPLSLYGDGMKKALTMLNAIVTAKNGVVLIDEFETALHISAMEKVFKFMCNISRQMNIQLFLTTHSIEAVDKLLKSSEENLEDIRIIRLKKKDGRTFSKVTNGEEASEIRKEYNMELRI